MYRYRHLPQKVKYAYSWGLEHTNAKWLVKVDDDFFVRVDALEKYLTTRFDDDKNVVVGHIANGWKVHRGGKWAERTYKPSRYPKFPLGSCGHAVTRSIAS